MTITKGSLRGFINSKTIDAKKEVHQDISAVFDTLENQLMKEIGQFNPLTDAATKLGDALEEFLGEHDLKEWEYERHVRDSRDIANLGHYIKNNEMSRIKVAVREDKPYSKFGMKGRVEQAKKETKPMYSKLKDIHTLENEMENVILSAGSGKKAYKDLANLGIDMVGYREEDSGLPSIQKLSVDPCLVNGNCN